VASMMGVDGLTVTGLLVIQCFIFMTFFLVCGARPLVVQGRLVVSWLRPVLPNLYCC